MDIHTPMTLIYAQQTENHERRQAIACRRVSAGRALVGEAALSNLKTIVTRCRMLAVIALLISHSTTYAQGYLNRSTCNYVSDPPAATTTHQTVSGSLPNGTTYNRYDFYLTAGRTYHFSLCSADGGGTDYDSYIGLYGTGGTQDYGCYANLPPTYFAYNDDDGCANNASRITYTATESRWTSLYISGYSTAYGSYTLVYWYDAPSVAPANSTCATATSLPCGTSNLAGTTVGTPGTAHGTSASVSNYGVWYTFTGDGGQTTITTVAGSGFDHEMDVFSGSCGNLTLLADRDVSGSGGTETYTFTTVSGTTYYVYIAYYGTSGTSTNTGTFTISRNCPPPPNATCNDATALPCGTSNLAGTTVNTTGVSHGTSANVSNYGVWYTFIGDGTQTTITSVAGSGYDHEMDVFSGSCGSLTLLADRDGGGSGGTETYTFTTMSGTTYYVYIAHYSASSSTTGTFTISRTCPPPCENATELPCGTSNLAGTTVGTTDRPHGTGASISNYGVWYTFIGDGTETTISSTAASGFDHAMVIVSGTCGGTFSLVQRLDTYSAGYTESYTFTPTSGVRYYVYIAHYSSTSTTTGSFTISRVCPCAPPTNLTVSDVTNTTAHLEWDGSGDSYNVRYRTAGHDVEISSFVQVDGDQTVTGILTEYTFDLSAYSGQGCIAIRHYNITDMFRLNIDDINLTDAGGNNIVSEGFESGVIPAGWFNYDSDGDGFIWKIWANNDDDQGNPFGTGNYIAYSESYDNDNTNPLTPDNWLIIPNVALGGTLSLYSRGMDPDWAAEVFGVFVTTETYIPTGDWIYVNNVSGTSLDISGLTPGTEYEWQVQSNCGGSLSVWCSPDFFTTCNLNATIEFGN